MVELLLFGTIFAAIFCRKKNSGISGIDFPSREYIVITVRNYTSEEDIISGTYYFSYERERDVANTFWKELQSELKSRGFVPEKQHVKWLYMYWRGKETVSIAAKKVKL